MNRLVVALVLCSLLIAVGQTSAASKMGLGVGGDVLIPTGTFGDAVSTGFGGSVRFQYNVTPMFAAGLTAGYYTWSGKDYSAGGVTIKGVNFKGLPVRAFGKYYFMPEGQKFRAYGIVELGLFFGSSGDIEVDNPLFGLPGQPAKITREGESGSDFNYAPGLGVEVPLGDGKNALDVSARYDGIATSGSSSGSIGFRVGVNFGLGD